MLPSCFPEISFQLGREEAVSLFSDPQILPSSCLYCTELMGLEPTQGFRRMTQKVGADVECIAFSSRFQFESETAAGAGEAEL